MAVKSFRAILLGDPPDPDHQVSQKELYDGLVVMQGAVTVGIVAYEDDLADLPAAAGVVDGAFAIVLNDATESNRGIYQEQSNAWVKVADLPETIADHSHVSTDITDSTATGRAVLTATDAAAGRAAIDAASQDDLDAEEAARIAADQAEEAARIAADDALDALISAEEAARIAADDALTRVTATVAGRVTTEDSTGQALQIIPGGPDGGVDFVPARALLDRFDAPEWINATIGIATAGQSNGGGSIVEQEVADPFIPRGRPWARRSATGVYMPNAGLGVHDVSAITDFLTDALTNPIATFGPITGFVPADERVNPKAGPKPMWSFSVPAAETFLALRRTGKPDVVVSAIGNGSQPLIKPNGSDRVGLHEDHLGNKTAFYNRAVHVLTRMIEIAAERGKPMTDLFITFDWGESVYGADPGFAGTPAERDLYRDQIDAYFTDIKAEVAAVDPDVRVHFLITQPGGNITRGNYPVRLSGDAVAAIRSDTWVIGAGFDDLFDAVHRTEDGKARAGTRYGYAIEAVLRERMWRMPSISIARSGTTITLTSDQPLREIWEFRPGGSAKGFTLSAGAATIQSVTLVDGFTLRVETDVSAAGQFLALGYRGAIGGEAAIVAPSVLTDPDAWPRAVHPFALARISCPSITLPGRDVPIYVTSRYWEVPA